MSLYPFGFPGVNLCVPPALDLHEPGKVCPRCRGVATFFYHERGTTPELVCTDCLTGAFDTADPALPPPPLRTRFLGVLPGTTVAVYEYFLEPAPGHGVQAGVADHAGTARAAAPQRRRRKRT